MRGLLPLTLFVILLVGCHGPRGFQASTGPGAAPPSNWSPEGFSLTCESGTCPSQVGLIVFVFPLKGDRYPIKKCTGFLAVSASTVFSVGHCDFTDEATGYFLTSASAPGGRQTIRIASRIGKVFTPGTKVGDEFLDSVRPDFVSYALARPVAEITPLEFANAEDPAPKQLVGYVVNGSEKDGKFTVEKISCAVHRHEAFFPYDLVEKPDVLKLFQCSSRKTNSGSPLFAPGREGRVEAIVQSNTLADNRNYGRMPSIVATNARCLKNSSSCVVADLENAERKFKQTHRDRVLTLAGRSAGEGSTEDVRYLAEVYPLASSGDNQEFEIFYKPVCRLNEASPSVLSMPSERVTLRYDEWAAPVVETVERQKSEFKVRPLQSSVFQLEGQWSPGFAALREPQKHPRARWGNIFPFELPKCVR